MANSETRRTDELWALVEAAFESICRAYNTGRLVPLGEADVAGYMYHALLNSRGGDGAVVHLNARLLVTTSIGEDDRDKYDLVIGPCRETEDRKRFLSGLPAGRVPDDLNRYLARKSTVTGFRPGVEPDLVLEFKLFKVGLGPPGSHLKGAINDVRKLATISSICPEGRGLVLFDEKVYLHPDRQKEIMAARAADSALRVYLYQPTAAGEMQWRLV